MLRSLARNIVRLTPLLVARQPMSDQPQPQKTTAGSSVSDCIEIMRELDKLKTDSQKLEILIHESNESIADVGARLTPHVVEVQAKLQEMKTIVDPIKRMVEEHGNKIQNLTLTEQENKNNSEDNCCRNYCPCGRNNRVVEKY